MMKHAADPVLQHTLVLESHRRKGSGDELGKNTRSLKYVGTNSLPGAYDFIAQCLLDSLR